MSDHIVLDDTIDNRVAVAWPNHEETLMRHFTPLERLYADVLVATAAATSPTTQDTQEAQPETSIQAWNKFREHLARAKVQLANVEYLAGRVLDTATAHVALQPFLTQLPPGVEVPVPVPDPPQPASTAVGGLLVRKQKQLMEASATLANGLARIQSKVAQDRAYAARVADLATYWACRPHASHIDIDIGVGGVCPTIAHVNPMSTLTLTPDTLVDAKGDAVPDAPLEEPHRPVPDNVKSIWSRLAAAQRRLVWGAFRDALLKECAMPWATSREYAVVPDPSAIAITAHGFKTITLSFPTDGEPTLDLPHADAARVVVMALVQVFLVRRFDSHAPLAPAEARTPLLRLVVDLINHHRSRAMVTRALHEATRDTDAIVHDARVVAVGQGLFETPLVSEARVCVKNRVAVRVALRVTDLSAVVVRVGDATASRVLVKSTAHLIRVVQEALHTESKGNSRKRKAPTRAAPRAKRTRK